MNKELEQFVASGESRTVEFKESFGKEAIETMTAFANGEGETGAEIRNRRADVSQGEWR